MPRLSRLFIKFSLIYLLAGFALGALILIQKGFGIFPAVWRWLPVHVELVIFGWILQLVMGVAYWILPRFGTRRRRGSAAGLAFGLINGGILLAVGAVGGDLPPVAFAARLLQTTAVACFLFHAWPRIKPFAGGGAAPGELISNRQ